MWLCTSGLSRPYLPLTRAYTFHFVVQEWSPEQKNAERGSVSSLWSSAFTKRTGKLQEIFIISPILARGVTNSALSTWGCMGAAFWKLENNRARVGNDYVLMKSPQSPETPDPDIQKNLLWVWMRSESRGDKMQPFPVPLRTPINFCFVVTLVYGRTSLALTLLGNVAWGVCLQETGYLWGSCLSWATLKTYFRKDNPWSTLGLNGNFKRIYPLLNILKSSNRPYLVNTKLISLQHLSCLFR